MCSRERSLYSLEELQKIGRMICLRWGFHGPFIGLVEVEATTNFGRLPPTTPRLEIRSPRIKTDCMRMEPTAPKKHSHPLINLPMVTVRPPSASKPVLGYPNCSTLATPHMGAIQHELVGSYPSTKGGALSYLTPPLNVHPIVN